MPDDPGETVVPPFEVGEDPVSALGLQVLDAVGEESFVVQLRGPRPPCAPNRTRRAGKGRAVGGMVTLRAVLRRVAGSLSRWSLSHDGQRAAPDGSRTEPSPPGNGGSSRPVADPSCGRWDCGATDGAGHWPAGDDSRSMGFRRFQTTVRHRWRLGQGTLRRRPGAIAGGETQSPPGGDPAGSGVGFPAARARRGSARGGRPNETKAIVRSRPGRRRRSHA